MGHYFLDTQYCYLCILLIALHTPLSTMPWALKLIFNKRKIRNVYCKALSIHLTNQGQSRYLEGRFYIEKRSLSLKLIFNKREKTQCLLSGFQHPFKPIKGRTIDISYIILVYRWIEQIFRMQIFGSRNVPVDATQCPKIYRKSVLHLLKYRIAVYLSRSSTDLR